jgi:hypothetical protein
MQLPGFPPASFSQSHTSLEPELEAMLQKTVAPNEAIFLKVQSAPGEAMVLTQMRIIILKGAKQDPAGRGYGRFFRLDEILRFEYRGWIRINFIAVITRDTEREKIPSFSPWKCSFGTTFVGSLGSSTAGYLKVLERWLADQRRNALLHGALPTITPIGVATQPGEQFYVQVPATYYEEKSVRQWTSGSTGVSIPIMRGVRMRVGNTRGHSTTSQVLQQDDQGTLLIGDHRVVFVGNRRNISIPLAAIATVEAFTNGLHVGVPNKMMTQFRTENDLPGLLLKRLLNIP